MGSASALRGMKRASSSQCGAGRAIGMGASRWGGVGGYEYPSQCDLPRILLKTPLTFPQRFRANPRFAERLQREVPLGRLVKADEDAEFAAYLCSDKADCFVGQVFPVCGGWVQR
jgi:2-keto-3-deoxy-L-fuconate dehydrogenase